MFCPTTPWRKRDCEGVGKRDYACGKICVRPIAVYNIGARPLQDASRHVRVRYQALATYREPPVCKTSVTQRKREVIENPCDVECCKRRTRAVNEGERAEKVPADAINSDLSDLMENVNAKATDVGDDRAVEPPRPEAGCAIPE